MERNGGWEKRLQIENDNIVEHQVQPRTKDELCALWTNVCPHGLKNWLFMLNQISSLQKKKKKKN